MAALDAVEMAGADVGLGSRGVSVFARSTTKVLGVATAEVATKVLLSAEDDKAVPISQTCFIEEHGCITKLGFEENANFKKSLTKTKIEGDGGKSNRGLIKKGSAVVDLLANKGSTWVSQNRSKDKVLDVWIHIGSPRQ